MMKTYPLFKVHVPVEKAMENIRKVLESGFINEGEQVTEFTNLMREKLHADNLIVTNSCTSALTIALKLAGVQPGDDVISTPMTCVATNTPIITMGAKIIWSDIFPWNGMIDEIDVVRKITPRTKAIMAVAWAGTPPQLDALEKICHDHGIKLILDAAHAFGASFKGKPIHEFADYTCYSFQAIKHITTGDGGALVCSDDKDHDRSKALKWFGLDREKTKDEKGNWKGQQWDTDVHEAGYKFNMNNVSAAIGLSQIEHIDSIIEKHRKNASIYDQMFLNNPDVVSIDRPMGSDSSFWVYTMRYVGQKMTRDELLSKLNAVGIMAGLVHVPNDDYTAFQSSKTDLPGVRLFSSQQFSLPCGWWLNDDDIVHIVEQVKELTI
jgi:perosamine synthetase